MLDRVGFTVKMRLDPNLTKTFELNSYNQRLLGILYVD